MAVADESREVAGEGGAQQKGHKIKENGRTWERLNEAWRCNLCLATARTQKLTLARGAETCKAGKQSFYDGSMLNGHTPFAAQFGGQADAVV